MFNELLGLEVEINPHLVAKSVLKLSDFYIENPMAETPWDEEFCRQAYRFYYLPLNAIRAELVIKRAQQVGFFEGLSYFIDWGCGPATLSLALATNQEVKSKIVSQTLYDISEEVLTSFADLHKKLVNPKPTSQLNLARIEKKSQTALMFSYSLTEVNDLPAHFNEFEALVILEPSTRDDGRKLLETRRKLIEMGYSIWGPCTHHQDCPLLTLSKTDWCHDRAHVEAPEWFEKIESLLPMKNRTVTTSYLLARKRKAPEALKNLARLTGDALEEKGKTRQLVCRGTQREYLSWLHRKQTPQILGRGELVKISESYEQVSNELRPQESIEVIKRPL